MAMGYPDPAIRRILAAHRRSYSRRGIRGCMSSAETYPRIAEAMTAAAIKPLDMPKRREALDRSEAAIVP